MQASFFEPVIMDKSAIVAALRRHLEAERASLLAAVSAAIEGATHEEAKPENEYDTRGLEQSYLAGAQAARLDALDASLQSLETFRPSSLGDDAPCQLGACVVVDDGESERRYFIHEVGGGSKLVVDGDKWVVLNPQSPLGRLLLGKRVGDVVEQVVRGDSVELELTELA